MSTADNEPIASHRAAQLAHAHADASLKLRADRFAALNRIAKALSSDLNVERIVQLVTDSATELSGAKFGAFFYNRTDERGESYVLFTIAGAPREAFEKFGLPRNTAVFEPTFRGTGIVRSDDIRQDPRYGHNAPHHGMPKGHLPVVSYLAVPVVSRSGAVLGGLFFGHDKPGVFTPDSEEIVVGIASHAAIAIDNANTLELAHREAERRRRSEQAARLLAAIVESSDDAIISKDLNGNILTWNKGAERLFGHAAAEAIGKPITILIPPDRQNEEPSILGRLRTGELVDHYETQRLRKDGSLVDVSLTISPVLDHEGRIVAASKIARDITERKRAEELLKAREMQLEVIVNQTPFMLTRCGRDLRYHLVSQAYASMLGKSPAEIEGKAIVDVIGPAALETIRPHFERVLAGERVEYEDEVAFAGVGPRHLHVVYMPEYGDDGVIGWIASILDITERKRAETQRDLLVAELSHRVKNNLSTVLSIARQSFPHGAKLEDARELFEARIHALAKTHARLSESHWSGVALAVILSGELMPYTRAERSNVVLSGPDVVLTPRQTLMLSLAIHELATNAAKHGALSTERGTVEVTWKRTDGFVEILWVETNGPPVVAPKRSGFGRLLLERALPADLRGTVQLEFDKRGLRCQMKVPLQ